MPPVHTSSFTPPLAAGAAHVAASASSNIAQDLKVTLRAVDSKISNRSDDPATRTIQNYVRAGFEATRPDVPWWNIAARIRRSGHESKHEQATLVLSMGNANGNTDGIYVGRRGLLFGSESANFFQLTDNVPERALKHAAGKDQGAEFMKRLDAALDSLAAKIADGAKPNVREAAFEKYAP